MAQIDAFFRLMKEEGASDLHLASGSQPILRIRGEMKRVKHQLFKDDELKKLLYEITPEEKVKIFEENGDLDFAYEIPGLARYRANYFYQALGISAVFREISSQILSIDELGLPSVLKKLALLPNGLVLVTGPTGSGKTTTLAAIINEANEKREDHILTIEDPLEFKHKNKGCLISHREVGTHTRSFAAALRAALREDPDIIMVGEMRDLETISLALEASNTGHLVLGTLHTTSATKTVDRIIDVFPANQQDQIRSSLADGLRAVLAQTLFKRIDKKGGRCAALEILLVNSAVRSHVREGKTLHIPNDIQVGKKFGMRTLDEAIMEHLEKRRIDPNDAYNRSIDKSMFTPFLKKPPDAIFNI
jgi:twitching motility protein PilT